MAASASEILKDLTELASDIQRADLVKHLIVYGSLVRGDYWPGRSDVDVYITVEKRYEEELKTRLKGAIFGIEPVFQGLDHFDKQRREVTDIQLRFHGFDTVDHHKCLIGTDPLKDFSVVRGKDLIPMARDRISELLKYSEKGRERPKQATEALKAIALLCSIMQGLKETRNKEELYRRYHDCVPVFAMKEFGATALWDYYKSKSLDEATESFNGQCNEFVIQIDELTRTLWPQ